MRTHHVVILSVPHSGTNLLQRILEDHGFVAAQWHRGDGGSSYTTTHLTDLGAVQRALNTGLRAIVPLRHPYRVEESWRRRVKDLNDGYFEAWEILADRVMPRDPFVMPVDVPDRDRHLRRLGEWLGTDLATDWPICGSRAGTHGLELAELNPSESVRYLVRDMDWLLARYYDSGV